MAPLRSGLLSSGSVGLRRVVERISTEVAIGAGTTLFTQGDEGETFYIVREGEIEISVLSLDGRRLVLDVMRRGELFGEVALFGGVRTATAVATKPSRLAQARRRDMLDAIRKEPDLSIEFIELLCERIRTVSRKLEERSFLALPARLAHCLIRLEARTGEKDGTIRIAQAELAQFVGATREGVAKTLAEWRSQGWVSLGRGSVQIGNRAALRAVADATEHRSS